MCIRDRHTPDVEYTFKDVGLKQNIPVLGLYPNYNNQITLMRPNTGNFTTTLADNGLQPEGLTVELNIKLSIEVRCV